MGAVHVPLAFGFLECAHVCTIPFLKHKFREENVSFSRDVYKFPAEAILIQLNLYDQNSIAEVIYQHTLPIVAYPNKYLFS